MTLTVRINADHLHRIRIYVSNGTGFVWTPEEVYELRASHHITGVLSGTLPSVAQQNVFLGLPLYLLPEEVVFLVDKEAAFLVDDIAAHNVSPSSERLATWSEFRKAESQAQANADLQHSVPEQAAASKAKAKIAQPEVVNAKKAEREAKKAALRAAVTNSNTGRSEATDRDSIDLFAPEESTSTPVSSPKPTIASSSRIIQPQSVTIPATSSSLPWYPSSDPSSAFAVASPVAASLLRHGHEFTSIDAAREAGVWTYPRTLEERARCAVFKDLHEKGHWLGGGIKFGGDWLVYPGDPLRYHSHFVATVYPTPTSSLRPMEIVALGRLGTATKKSHLLCGWDEKTGRVDYYSIEWAGFG